MKRFLRMYSIEQKMFFRSPDVILFCLIMPLAVFLLVTLISGGREAADSELTFMESSYAALSTVGICCCAFMSIPIVTVELRDKGVLRRIYCSPCSPARILACDTIASGMMAVVSTLLLTAAAVLMGYRMSGSVVLYAGVWILTMISMFSIGLVVAGLCRTTKSLNIATSLLYFPMLLFSGATIPAEIFPTGVQAIMKWLPLGIGIDSLKKISVDCYNNLAVPLAVLAAIATVCTIAAVKTFRWE